MTWVLLLLVAQTDTMAVTQVPGFRTLASCSEAAAKSEKAFKSWAWSVEVRTVRTVCVAQPEGK